MRLGTICLCCWLVIIGMAYQPDVANNKVEFITIFGIIIDILPSELPEKLLFRIDQAQEIWEIYIAADTQRFEIGDAVFITAIKDDGGDFMAISISGL